VFVRALPADNPYLSSAYWDELNSLPEPLRRAWVEGDWNVFAGQVFSEWRYDVHVCDPFEIPAHWIRWRAVDWGYSQPFCCLWFAQQPGDDRVYVYRELYAAGLTDREQARRIRELSAGESIRWTLADPSMWTTKTHENATFSTADEYGAEGVWLSPADNDRLTGVRRVHQALAMRPDGKPGLLVFRTCVNLIRTLPALPYDAARVEDVDTDAEDHAYDALRYGLMRGIQRETERYQPRDVFAGIG